MKKNLIKLFQLLSVLLILLFLFNCQEPSSESSGGSGNDDNQTSSLVGQWLSSYDELFIVASNETPPMFYSQYAGSTSYAGEIIEHDDYSGTSGYITILYTENAYYPEVVGKYYRIYWKNLTLDSCNISGAYLYDSSLPPEASDPSNPDYPDYIAQFSADTLDDAKNKFIVENGAFLGGSDCNKQ